VSQLHGWLILDKPLGLGSTNAVSAVKRALRQGGYAKTKVGHGGTLDPLATGVLPIALGEATKLAGRMLDASKEYEFTVQFGRETDTLDLEGAVVATSDHQPGFGAFETALERHFTGEIDQVPPAYSALKVDGARAYDLARAGEAVDLPSRRVIVGPWRYIAEGCVGEWDRSEQYATVGVTVSKGTYIRSLARDIAYALGTVGHVTMLRRTRAGPFGLIHAISLDKLDEAVTGRGLEALLRPIEAGLDGIPALPLTPDQAAALRQGRVLLGQAVDDGLHFATLDAVPVALVEVQAGAIRVERGFNLNTIPRRTSL
jgi:tRNA pseudouridine55 synthase